MRIEERRDKEVIGGGFGLWEKECPAIVHSLPIAAVAALKITNYPFPACVPCFTTATEEEGKRGHVAFLTHSSLKVTFSFKVKTCARSPVFLGEM